MSIYISDAHCDFLAHSMECGCRLDRKCVKRTTLLSDMLSNHVHVQNFAIWTGKGNHTENCRSQLNIYKDMLKHPDITPLTKSSLRNFTFHQSTPSAGLPSKLFAVLSLEGADAIAEDAGILPELIQSGLASVSLTWNHSNIFGGGVDDGGMLTVSGKELIRELGSYKVAVDVSHLSPATFWDVAAHSQYPIMASHSNSWHVKAHKRNLSREQILEIIDQKGFIGINFYAPFLGKMPSMEHVAKNIDYIFGKGGAKTVGFGADFDMTDNLPRNCSGMSSYWNVVKILRSWGYTDTVLEDICGNNYLRYISQFIK